MRGTLDLPSQDETNLYFSVPSSARVETGIMPTSIGLYEIVCAGLCTTIYSQGTNVSYYGAILMHPASVPKVSDERLWGTKMCAVFSCPS